MMWRRVLEKSRIFLEMIKFEHTLFALPFAYLGLFLAEGGLPGAGIFFAVTLAMIGMRTAGMSFNRIADRAIDARNPRTANWALPKKQLPLAFVWGAFLLSLLIFAAAVSRLHPVCRGLSVIPVLMIMIYPFLKRFTFAAHFFLGMILGLAPAGAWVASRGSAAPEAWLLWLGVACWVAGFDLIYALQDEQFDRQNSLFSFAAVFGRRKTLTAASLLHVLTVFFFILLGLRMALGKFYWAGILVAVFFLVREQWVIRRQGLAAMQEAFFVMNVMVSMSLFLAVSLDLVF